MRGFDETSISDEDRAELKAWAWYFGATIVLAALMFTVGYLTGSRCA